MSVFVEPSKIATPSVLVHHSTVAIVPGDNDINVWNRIQDLRYNLKDRGFYRWPPHINILYPFIKPGEIDVTAISSILRHQCPFEITLKDFQIFGGRNRRGVLWLNPVTPKGDEIQNLHSSITSIFESNPDPSLFTTFRNKPFNPHMTVCHYETSTMASEMASKLQTDWSPVSFTVREVLIMERNGDSGQFHVAYRIPLCGSPPEDILNYITHEVPYVNERFLHLPEVEEEWVRESRLLAKKRSKVISPRTESTRQSSRSCGCETKDGCDGEIIDPTNPIII